MTQATKKIFLWLPLLFSALFGYAQKTRFIGIEDGPSNNTVTSIYKDQNGFMWFGMLDGLNCYDGSSFKVFKNIFKDTKTLPDDIVKCKVQIMPGTFGLAQSRGI